MSESSSGKYFKNLKDLDDEETAELKIDLIKEIGAMQCCHCGSTNWEEADYNAKTEVVSVCDQCHRWDSTGKANPILDS